MHDTLESVAYNYHTVSTSTLSSKWHIIRWYSAGIWTFFYYYYSSYINIKTGQWLHAIFIILAGKPTFGRLPPTLARRRWRVNTSLAMPVCLTPVCACQLIGCRHLIRDAGLLYILQHARHAQIHRSPAPRIYSSMESKQAECLHAGVVVDVQWHNTWYLEHTWLALSVLMCTQRYSGWGYVMHSPSARALQNWYTQHKTFNAVQHPFLTLRSIQQNRQRLHTSS